MAIPMTAAVRRQAPNEAFKTQQSLASITDMTPDEIRAIRPPLPQIQLFPPREGYGDGTDSINIGDCFRASRNNLARNDFSGESGSYSASSTPSNGVW